MIEARRIDETSSGRAALWAGFIGGVKAGNGGCLKALFASAGPQLQAVLAPVCSSRADADAILADVFVRVWHEAGAFDPQADDACAWMFGRLREAVRSGPGGQAACDSLIGGKWGMRRRQVRMP